MIYLDPKSDIAFKKLFGSSAHKNILISTCILLFCIDRITKHLALAYCASPCIITPFLSFHLTFNRGISWGILNKGSLNTFYTVTALIITVTAGIIWYAYQRLRAGYHIWGESFIITGSLSNIIDRFAHPGVVDFIELSFNTWTWPVFNCADTYIVIGVILMLMPLYYEP